MLLKLDNKDIVRLTSENYEESMSNFNKKYVLSRVKDYIKRILIIIRDKGEESDQLQCFQSILSLNRCKNNVDDEIKTGINSLFEKYKIKNIYETIQNKQKNENNQLILNIDENVRMYCRINCIESFWNDILKRDAKALRIMSKSDLKYKHYVSGELEYNDFRSLIKSLPYDDDFNSAIDYKQIYGYKSFDE